MFAGCNAPLVTGLQTLSQVADDNKLIIAVGYMLRSSPAVIAAKQLMAEVIRMTAYALSLMLA